MHKTKKNDPVITKVLSEVNAYKLDHVQLIGGEVTVLKDLPGYLSLLDKAKWKSIVTNGRIFRADITSLVDEIYISLHGKSHTHEEITGAPNSFLEITKNIEKYVQNGIEVNSDTVLTKYNYSEVYDIAKMAKDLGMSRLFLNIFQPEGLASTRPDFSPSIYQIRSAIDQMLRAREDFQIEMLFGTSTPYCLDERLITEDLAFTCGAGTWFASINPSGELRICNHSNKPYGNILKEPLNKIWHSRNIDFEYRNKELAEPVCRDCPFMSQCLGGCRINSDGTYRVDPIVIRDQLQILPLTRRKQLFATTVN